MVVKSGEQRMEELSKKIKILEAQRKQIEARTKAQDRKDRTRKLIQVGAIVDSMGIDNIDLAEKFKTYFMNTPKSKEWLEKFIADDPSKTITE